MGAGAVVACCSYCTMLSLFTGLHGSAGNGLCKRSRLFVWHKAIRTMLAHDRNSSIEIIFSFLRVSPRNLQTYTQYSCKYKDRTDYHLKVQDLPYAEKVNVSGTDPGGVWWFAAVLGDRSGSYHVLETGKRASSGLPHMFAQQRKV